MVIPDFDQVSQRFALAGSRRASLAMLGGGVAAIMALGSSGTFVAAKNKDDDSYKDQEKKLCRRNTRRCRRLAPLVCDTEPQCLDAVTDCCKECHSAKFLLCLAQRMPMMTEP